MLDVILYIILGIILFKTAGWLLDSLTQVVTLLINAFVQLFGVIVVIAIIVLVFGQWMP